MPTIAELTVAFRGDTKDFDAANRRVQGGLDATTGKAGDAAEAFVALTNALGGTAAGFTAVDAAAVAYSRSVTDSVISTRLLTKELGVNAKVTEGVAGAMTAAVAATTAAKSEFASASKWAAAFGADAAALRSELQSLNRTFGSVAATNYANKLEAGGAAAAAMEAKVATLTAQIAALNAELATTKATGFPRVDPGGNGGGGAASQGLTAKKLGKGLTTYVSAPILLAGGAALAVGAQYEEATARMQSFAGVSAEEVDRLRPKLIALAEATGQMPTELAKAMFYIQSSGIHGAEAMQVLTQAAKGSTAGLGKLEDVAQAMTSAKYSFGVPAKQIGDIVAKAAVLAHADPGTFFKSMGQAIPIASALKLKLEDVMGVVAMMTREGLSPAKGFQRLTAMVDSVTAPTPKQRLVAQKMHIDFGDLRQEMSQSLGAALEDVYTKSKGKLDLIRQLFGGRRAGDAAIAFFNPNAVKENIALLDKMAHSAGTVDHAFRTASQTLKVQVDQAKAALAGAAIAAEAVLAPAAKTAAVDVRHLADSFSQLSPRAQVNVVEALALAAAIGPVIRGIVGITTVSKAVVGPLAAYNAAQKAAGVQSFALAASSGAAKAGLLGTAEASAAAKASILATAQAFATAALLMAAPIIITYIVKTVYDYSDATKQAEKSGTDAASFAFSPKDYRAMRRRQGTNKTNAQLNDEFKHSQYYDAFMHSGPNGATRDQRVKAAAQRDPTADMDARAAAIAAQIRGVTGGKGFDLSDSGPIKGGGGRQRRGGGETEADQQVQSLKDRIGSLATTYRLLGSESDAAALKQEILGGEFATAGQRAKALSSVLQELRGRGQLDSASRELFGRSFNSLGSTDKLKAEAYALQLVTDKRKADADAAKAQAQAIKDAIQAAKQAANEATKSLAESRRPEIYGKSAAEYAEEISQERFGKKFGALDQKGEAHDAVLQEAQALAAKDRDAWAKELTSFERELKDHEQDALDKTAEAIDRRAKATAKRAEEIGRILNEQNKARDDAKAKSGGSLADQRAQYVTDAVNAHPEIKDDLDARLKLEKAAGEAFDAKQARAYADEIGRVHAEMAKLGPQTDQARLALIRYADDGTERFTEAQAKAILAAEKLNDRLKAQQDQARQAGEMVGSAFSSGMDDAIDNGLKGGIGGLVKNFLNSLDKEIAHSVVQSWTNSISGFIRRSLLATQNPGASVPTGDPGIGGSEGAWSTAGAAASMLPGILGHFDKGGSVQAGRAVVWQEHPGEVFVPKTDGTIIPTDVVRGIVREGANGGGGGGGGDVHHHYHNTFAPTINAQGTLDRRSLEQTARASFELGQKSAQGLKK